MQRMLTEIRIAGFGGQGVILSMLGSGPNDLGRKLIEAIYT